MRNCNYKAFVVVMALFAVTTTSFAQRYSIFPKNTVTANAAMEDLKTLTIQQVNTTNDTLQLQWKKISASVPDKWEASMCDNQFCNTSLADSGMMNPVLPNDYGFVLIHCTVHVNYGTAIIRYAVWDVTFPNTVDTLTFIINSSLTGISEADSEKQVVWIDHNKICLKNNDGSFDNLRITDIRGKVIYHTVINDRTDYELPTLPASVYFIQLLGSQKHFLHKIWYQP